MKFSVKQKAWIRAAFRDTVDYHILGDEKQDVMERTFCALLSRKEIAPWRPSMPYWRRIACPKKFP
jgi:hypothetical protein